jgi:hypothetical protein
LFYYTFYRGKINIKKWEKTAKTLCLFPRGGWENLFQNNEDYGIKITLFLKHFHTSFSSKKTRV